MGCGYFIICVILLFIFPPLGIFALLVGMLASITKALNQLSDKQNKDKK